MEVSLGEIKKVAVRGVWRHEESFFTPWLAEDVNIAKLGEALGLELQVEGVEVPVGPFSADILAKDSSGGFVVIENQFGKTDHDHLGKILTYAATLDARSVIWLAERFTDEHRKAIEWLNDRTTDDLSLYAVEVELWRIDESRPALRFNVLSQPTEIVRQATAIKASASMTDAQRLQLEFWTQFRDRLLDRKVVTSTHTPGPRYWFDVPLGRSNIFLSNFANTYDNRIGIRVYLGNQVAEKALPQLESEKAEIESELGEELSWNPNPEKRDKVIALSRAADLSNKAAWPEYIEWLVDRVARFKNVFGPRVRKLDLSSAGKS